MDIYETQTYTAPGPNGEPLTVRVRLAFDNDYEPWYGVGVAWSKLRGPCYHPRVGVIVGNPRLWDALVEDRQRVRDYCDRADDDDRIEAWLDLRDADDALREEDYTPEAHAKIRSSWDWYNLDPSGNYTGLPREEARRYCEQDAARLRGLVNGHWWHCGVLVDVSHAGREIAEHSVWGYESDDPELRDLRTHHVTEEAIADACRELARKLPVLRGMPPTPPSKPL